VDSLQATLSATVVATNIRLKVVEPVALRIRPDSLTLILNDSAVLSVNSFYPNNGVRACPEALIWTSLSPALVQVDNAGRVNSFGAAGEAVVFCTGASSGLTDSIRVTVLPHQENFLLPTEDAFVTWDYSYADSNFGSAGYLSIIGYYGDSTNRFYLKFDLSGLGEAPIVSARLRLTLTDAYGANHTYPGTMPITVYGVDDVRWSENTLTWNNRPLPGAALNTAVIDPTIVEDTTFEWDVTTWAQACSGQDMSLFLMNVGSGGRVISPVRKRRRTNPAGHQAGFGAKSD